MRVNAKYPVFIEDATVPGYRLPRPVFQIFDTVVNIAEHSAADLPVALSTHTMRADRKQDRFTEFRHREGSFFRPHMWGRSDLLTHMLSKRFNRDGEIGRLLDMQAARAKARGLARRAVPEGIVEDILNLDNGLHHHAAFYDKREAGIVAPACAEAVIVQAGEAFQQTCERYVLVDGELWVECPEPVLSVDVHDRPGRMACLSANMLPDVAKVSQTERPSLGEVLFPVTAYEEARQLSDRSYDPSMPWRSREFTMDLRMPEVFSADLPIGDALGQLEHCTRADRLPKALRNRLISFLSDEANWTEERLHDEVDHVLSQVPEQQRWMVRAIEHQQARFEARTVYVQMSSSPSM